MHNFVIDSDEHDVHLTQRQDENVSSGSATKLDLSFRNGPSGMTYLPMIPNGEQWNKFDVITSSCTVQASLLTSRYRYSMYEETVL
jgi:hypothetical protein